MVCIQPAVIMLKETIEDGVERALTDYMKANFDL